ncbi:MAG: carotenoid oxygenase family protein [Deltaproteobacteria bacterium]|nr:carotenoid oxygenase family protein [Deltaproteobacteria bacterium]
MTTSPFLSGNFAPIEEEFTATDLEVKGELPRELNGRLLRIGPNPVAPVEPYHWFTGNGMVHGLRLRDGRAEWYRNRYVRDDEVIEAKGWPEVPGPRHGMGGNTANTNVISHAGKTWAIVEAGGLPVELTDDLETVTRSDFGGTLQGSFSAHPKKDPLTGELHAVTYYWEWDHLKHVVVGTDGRVRRSLEVPVPGGPMVHDTAITESQVVLFDMPCIFDPGVMEQGGSFPYTWRPDYGTRIGLLPLEGAADDVRWFEIDNCYVFHPLNAYDAGNGQVVLDAVRHEKVFDQETNATEGNPMLTRWTFDLAGGSVKEEQLDDRPIEFPRHDERKLGRKLRYGYASSFVPSDDEAVNFTEIIKYDLEAGSSESWKPGKGRAPMEAVFVPRSDDSAEDDGFLLSYVYDAAEDRTDVVVLDAANITAGPIASVPLPTRVPFGFHGNFVPDEA